jgi:hypothetical protein
MIRRLTLLLALVLAPSLAIPGYAKCACLSVTFQVEVRGQINAEQSVTADVDPYRSWQLLLAGSSPNHLVIQVPFDQFSGRSFFTGDRCNRKPRTITVMVRHWLHIEDHTS